MLKTVLLSFVTLHAVIGNPIDDPHTTLSPATCLDLTPPFNGGVEQTSDFSQQYEIKQSKSQINSEDTVQFTISGKGNNDTMRGFIAQVRPEGNTTAVGKFIVDPSDLYVITIDCGNEKKNTAFIKIPVHKTFTEVSMTWSPNGYKGKVNFVATVMKTIKIFWVARKSSDLIVN